MQVVLSFRRSSSSKSLMAPTKQGIAFFQDIELRAPGPDDAPEADVAHTGVDHLRLPRGRAIAKAVVGGAQMRSALDYAARDAKLRLARVVALLRRDNARIEGSHTARLDGR